MLNRRAFLQRFGIGVAAACALASLPESAVNALSLADAGKRFACDYLRKRFNEYSRDGSDRRPEAMRVSPGLFEAYEGELLADERFMPADTGEPRVEWLSFKGVTLCRSNGMTGWDVEFTRDLAQRLEWIKAGFAHVA